MTNASSAMPIVLMLAAGSGFTSPARAQLPFQSDTVICDHSATRREEPQYPSRRSPLTHRRLGLDQVVLESASQQARGKSQEVLTLTDQQSFYPQVSKIDYLTAASTLPSRNRPAPVTAREIMQTASLAINGSCVSFSSPTRRFTCTSALGGLLLFSACFDV
jgi:hypothetical protein